MPPRSGAIKEILLEAGELVYSTLAGKVIENPNALAQPINAPRAARPAHRPGGAGAGKGPDLKAPQDTGGEEKSPAGAGAGAGAAGSSEVQKQAIGAAAMGVGRSELEAFLRSHGGHPAFAAAAMRAAAQAKLGGLQQQKMGKLKTSAGKKAGAGSGDGDDFTKKLGGVMSHGARAEMLEGARSRLWDKMHGR